MSELKPCPFCGCTDIATEETICDSSVWCRRCGARHTRQNIKGDHGMPVAVYNWQSRPTDDRVSKLVEALKPPEGYRLTTVDNSIIGRCSATFKLLPDAATEWHLQGEVLNAAGEDIRPKLYITRITNINLTEAL